MKKCIQMKNNRLIKSRLRFICLAITGTLLLSFTTFGQSGSLSGQVKDGKTGETLPGANIWIEQIKQGTITDFNGMFLLEQLKPGTYQIRVSFISYDPVILTDIQIEPGRDTRINISLQEATTSIGEVTVVAVRRSDTEVAVLSAVKNSPLVANGISSKQISQSQDKDASEAIRRIPGVTIIDNRFVVVRGLNQRYNNVWLNNASTPGSESDSKAFSFDIIPTSMIDNLMIYKSASPELPADFSGGFISIHTKNMPEKNQYTVSFQGLYNPQATFHTFQSYEGGRLDWLGVDDGTRRLPSYFPENLQSTTGNDQIELSKRLNSNWLPIESTTLPDMKIGFTMAHRFTLGKTSLGEITAINYSRSRNLQVAGNRSFAVYDYRLDRSGMDFDFIDSTFTQGVNLGLLNNWSWYLGRGNKLEFRNLISNQGESSSLFRNGTEYYSNTVIRSLEYGYKSRFTYSGQLSGTHAIGDQDFQIDWVAGYAHARREEPDIRRVKLIQNDNITDPNYGRFFLEFPANPLSSNAGRLFMNTIENLWSGALNASRKFEWGTFKPILKAGLFLEGKNRSFAARKLGYIYADGRTKDPTIQYLPIDELLGKNHMNSITGIKLAEETSKSDAYQASNQLLAGYLSLNLPISTRINLFTGVRMEKNRQLLSSHDRFQQPVTVEINTLNLFPSANLTYRVNDRNLLRMAYGQSVNRPEFREIAPFPFYDFGSNAVFSGNPDLTDAQIHNFDLRYELYPDRQELISAGVFYKRFFNPIEIKYIETGSGLEYSYHNALGATNYGVEAEIRKSLGNAGWLQNLILVFNGALIQSRVDFPEGSIEQGRPLAGQSPYVLNLGLFYAGKEKDNLDISLMYNIIGPRIYIVGQPKSQPWEYIPNIYEMPRHQVDLTLTKKFGDHLELKVGIKDLFNQPVVFEQSIHTDVDLSFYGVSESNTVHFDRRQVFRQYRPGSWYSIGIQYVF